MPTVWLGYCWHHSSLISVLTSVATPRASTVTRTSALETTQPAATAPGGSGHVSPQRGAVPPITASRVVSTPAVPVVPADEAAKDRDAEPVSVGAALPESSFDSAFGDDDLDIPDFLK